MKNKEKYIPVLLCTIALLFLIYHLDKTQRFLFFYREQQQMFLYDLESLCDRYVTLSGFSLFFTHFIGQFFSIPLIGPIATALIGTATSYLLWLVIKRIHNALYLLPICFLPLLFQVHSLFDFNYEYLGFFSFFLTAVFLYLYARFAHAMKVLPRIAFASVLSLGLYFLAGSVGLLLACAILVYDVIQKEERSYLQVITVALVLLLGFYFIIQGEIQSSRYAYLNDFNYEPTMQPGLAIQYSWFALIGLLCVALLSRFIPKMKKQIELGLTMGCFILVAAYYIQDANRSRRNVIYPIIELQNYIVNEEWDKILNSKYLNINNYLITNYANLALSHKGMLLSHLFDLPQNGANSLMLQGNFAETTPEIWSISTHILYQMGNIASARNIAFDSFVADRYGNPSITKMMAKTNIIFGDYPIAEKYIKILEKTWRYKSWAKTYRKFLYRDDLVEADPELSQKRKDLPPEGTYPFVRGVYVDLLNILDGDTPDRNTIEYAIAFLLLTKDAKSLSQFMDKYHGTKVLEEVPVLLQEALVENNEFNLDYCREHGVTEETINRYKQFNQKLRDTQVNGLNPEAALRREFGRTYWYYSLCNF